MGKNMRDLLRAVSPEDFGLGDFSAEGMLLAASRIVKNPRVSTALAWGSIGVQVAKRTSAYIERRNRSGTDEYVITAELDDPVGIRMMAWIINNTPTDMYHSVSVERAWGGLGRATSDSEDVMDEMEKAIFSGSDSRPSDVYPNLNISFNESYPVETVIGGHPVVVRRIDNQTVANEDGKEQKYVTPHIEITCKSASARDAVFARLNDEFNDTKDKKEPSLFQADRWGAMQRVRGVPPRSLDTVVLKPGQLESIVDDITRFLASESYYTDLGIPYHHGILLHGIPGTGKTSAAAAISHALNLDVFHVALPDITNNDSLYSLLRAVRPRSVLLLEEIDSFSAANRHDGPVASEGDNRGVTRDGLLQALDGFAAPHGLITMMTTNHLDRLDPALVRAGRIDLKVELGAVDALQVRNICQRFLGYVPDGLPPVTPADGIAPSELIGVFKRFIYDKAGAGPAVVARINELLIERDIALDLVDVQEKQK